jgi:hypothetical protein
MFWYLSSGVIPLGFTWPSAGATAALTAAACAAAICVALLAVRSRATPPKWRPRRPVFRTTAMRRRAHALPRVPPGPPW